MSKYFTSSEFPWESILCWSLVVEIPLDKMRQCSNIPDKLGGEKKRTAHLRLLKTFLSMPVHRLPHQCCLTRLCEPREKSDWRKLWKEAWSQIHMVNHNRSPTLHLNEDLFWEGFPWLNCCLSLEVEWSRYFPSYTLPRHLWIRQGLRKDLWSTLHHQAKENYLRY